MNIWYIVFGYFVIGGVMGLVHCLLNTRAFRRDPSAELRPYELAATDYLLRSLFLWPWMIVRSGVEKKRSVEPGPANSGSPLS